MKKNIKLPTVLGCSRCGRDHLVFEKSGTLIRCTKCGAQESDFSALSAIKAWNIRQSSDKLDSNGTKTIGNF